MAIGKKLGAIFGFDDDEYEDEDYYDDEDEVETVEPIKPSKANTGSIKTKEPLMLKGKVPDCIFARPKRFEECFTLADKITERHVVIINFDSVSQPIAHRLVDFLSGVAYACDSKINQVAKDTHVVVPSACAYDDISEALEDILD